MKDLLPYATERQAEKINALEEHGSQRKAAEALGVSRRCIRSAVEQVKRKAAKQGHSPEHDMVNTVPEGYHIKGVSTNYGADGEIKQQWVKSQVDKEKQEELLRIVADTLCEDVKGRCQKPTKAPKISNTDLLAVYPMPEPHFGMFSWGKETGDDYDCTEAGNILLRTMQQLVDSAPPAQTSMISSLGDWFHTDTTSNTTAKAGNQLDVDSRWPRVVGLGVTVFKQMVAMALEKHAKVIIKGVGGNHDPHTNFLLALVLDAYYDGNKRVEVDLSPGAFKFHRFGKNLLGINHGDMAKIADLPLIMATDQHKDWGETEHRLWLTGHVHHLTRKEFTGCTVESLRSVAARDSWHYQSGYRAGRDAKAIIFHKDNGEVQRITVAV